MVGAGINLDRDGRASRIARQLLARRGDIPNYTPGGMLAPKREHTLEFNLLHRSVAAAFSDYGIEGHVDGIDLPINVRMVYGDADATRLNAPFSSSKIHSDVWAGVPGHEVHEGLCRRGQLRDSQSQSGSRVVGDPSALRVDPVACLLPESESD